MDIGGVIRKYRKEKNLKQSELAAQLHVSPQAVSSWEKNRTQPKMEMIEDMCRIFDCKKSDFLSDIPTSVELVLSDGNRQPLGIIEMQSDDNDPVIEMLLTSQEAHLINTFRKLLPDDKKAITRMVRSLLYAAEFKKIKDNL